MSNFMQRNMDLVAELSSRIHRLGTSPKVAMEFIYLINNLLQNNKTLISSGSVHENEFIAQLIFWFPYHHKIWDYIKPDIKPEDSADIAMYQCVFRKAYQLNYTTWAKYDDVLSLAKSINFDFQV